MIKVVEGRKAGDGARKGLAVSVTFQEEEDVQSEFYRVKDALLDWQRTRGEACGAVELEYQADESTWEQIEAFWLAKVDGDYLMRSFFVSVGKVDLCLVTPTGSKIKTIGFELGRNA